MKQSTLVALKAILQADPPRSDRDRTQLMQALDLDPVTTTPTSPPADAVLSFDTVGKIFDKSKRWTHVQIRAGHLKPAFLPGGVRSCGILQSSVDALLAAMQEGGAA